MTAFDDLLAAVGPDGEDSRWHEKALCAEVDLDLMFPEKGASTRDAKRVCAACPVSADCLEYALRHEERFGIWGGRTLNERRVLLGQKPKKRVVERASAPVEAA